VRERAADVTGADQRDLLASQTNSPCCRSGGVARPKRPADARK
jgi:hypothetical protein